MATGLGLFIPTDWGELGAPPTRHGEILRDAAGQPVAVITGTPQSNGDEPWTIFGERKWIAVGLAQFRVSKMMGWYGVNVPDADAVLVTSWQLAPGNTAADSNGSYVSNLTTEAHMDATFAQDAGQDSRRKTDLLLQGGHPSSYPPDAATHCRSIVPIVDGVPTPMDLPRQSVLMRIYQARDLIDAIDPTLSANLGNSLKQSTWGKFPGGSAAYVYSSSVYGPRPAYSHWYVRSDGYSLYYDRTNVRGVIPALEIPAE